MKKISNGLVRRRFVRSLHAAHTLDFHGTNMHLGMKLPSEHFRSLLSPAENDNMSDVSRILPIYSRACRRG
jgi:hypothetical protein